MRVLQMFPRWFFPIALVAGLAALVLGVFVLGTINGEVDTAVILGTTLMIVGLLACMAFLIWMQAYYAPQVFPVTADAITLVDTEGFRWGFRLALGNDARYGTIIVTCKQVTIYSIRVDELTGNLLISCERMNIDLIRDENEGWSVSVPYNWKV